MTVTTLLTAAGLFFYALATFSAYRHIQMPQEGSRLAGFLLVGLLTQLALLAVISLKPTGMIFNLNNALLIVSALTMLVLWAVMLKHKLALLSLILAPMTALTLLFNEFFPSPLKELINWSLTSHIMTSLLAYVLFGFAAAQGLLYAYQERQIRAHKLTAFVKSLPPLKNMEDLLFNLIKLGFIILSLSLLTGFFFLENLFAQHLAHKTFFSLLAWVVFLGLLLGRQLAGWRGQTAVRWTLIGYLLLALGFVGSRFILEYFIL
jgi:ABC-type uncharacterized transport system permease subunit